MENSIVLKNFDFEKESLGSILTYIKSLNEVVADYTSKLEKQVYNKADELYDKNIPLVNHGLKRVVATRRSLSAEGKKWLEENYANLIKTEKKYPGMPVIDSLTIPDNIEVADTTKTIKYEVIKD